MPVRIVLALLARSLTDMRALRPERTFVHELVTRTTDQTQHGIGRSRSSLEEALAKKKAARAGEQDAARAESSAATPTTTTPDSTMNLYRLKELDAKKFGGRCMDGTQAGYYYGPPSSGVSTTWVFYMNGGGGCSDVEDCATWMTTAVGETQADKGSSGWRDDSCVMHPNCWSETYGGKSFLSSDQAVNPGFHDAHHVRIPYCTGDSHGGTIGDPEDDEHGGVYVHEEKGGLYLDGHLNFRRILRDLEDTHGLSVGHMQHVLLYGGSAGGKGVFYNCDFLQTEIINSGGPSNAVKCSPQSGMFMPAYWANGPLEAADENASPMPWESWVNGLPRPETTAGLYGRPYNPPECEAEDIDCASAGMMYKYIQAPMYVKQDEFDTALVGNLGLRNEPGGEDLLGSAEGQTYQSLVGKSIRTTLKEGKAGDGVYLTSCAAHGGHAATVNGGTVTYEESLADWFWRGRGTSWVDQDLPFFLMDDCTEEVGLACNPDCDVDACTLAFIEICVDNVEQGDLTCEGCLTTNKDDLIAKGCNQQGFMNAMNHEVCHD